MELEQQLRRGQSRPADDHRADIGNSPDRTARMGRQRGPLAGSTSSLKRPLALAVGLAALLVLSAAASACGAAMGDMGRMHDEMHGGGPKVAQTPVASSATEVTVEIRDYDFFPRDLTVRPGASVAWVNRDNAPHDATDVDRAWGTDTLGLKGVATLKFDTAGEYDYVCTIHPNMEAKLTVA